MKKIIFLLLLLSSLVIIAKEYEIAPQRMITDFNGVSYFDGKILCYGDYGIITYSEDMGISWKQITIGDGLNIKKMSKSKNKIYAITDNKLIVSEDGLEWEDINLDDEMNFSSICTSDDFTYFIANKSIYKLDDDDNNITFEYGLKSGNHFQGLAFKNNNLFFIQDSMEVKKFNITEKSISTIFDKSHEIKFYDKISNLKIVDANIYVLFLKEVNQNKKYDIFNCIYTEANDINWQIIQDNGYTNESYFINNNDFFWIDYNIYDVFNDSDQRFLKYIVYKINDDKEQVFYSDSLYIKSKDFFRINSFNISETISINDSIIVSVGTKKSILISYDGGKSFETVSNVGIALTINSIYSDRFYPNFIINNNVINCNELTKSTNGGIIWKPVKINEQNHILLDEINYLFNYSKLSLNGNNFYVYKNHVVDIANNEVKKFNEYDDQVSKVNNLNGLVYNEQIVTGFLENDYKNRYTEFNILDKNYNLVETFRIDSMYIRNIFNTKDNGLIALAYHYRDHDSEYVWNDRGYSFLKSDNLKDWDEIQIELPIPDSSDKFITQYMFDDKILFMNNYYYDQSKIIYYYDIEKNIIDSIQTPFVLNNISFYDQIFEHKDKIYFISNESKLYYTENLFENDINWQIIDFGNFLSNWEPFDMMNQKEGKDVIYSGFSDNEQIYLISGKSYIQSGFMGSVIYGFSFNLIKLYDMEDETSVDETETRNYLYTYPPYPQPASTEVRSLVYWDTSLEMNKESVKIYNTNGVEVGKEQDITFERLNAYSGNLIWNCTNVPDGVYLIQISHGDKKRTIKVMVRK